MKTVARRIAPRLLQIGRAESASSGTGSESGSFKIPNTGFGPSDTPADAQFQGGPQAPIYMEHLAHAEGRTKIDGFKNNLIQVDGKLYGSSVMCLPEFTLLWAPNKLEEITTDHFMLPAMHYPRIRHIFIGVGAKVNKPTPTSWFKWFMKNQMTFDIMTTGAACSHFNLLNGTTDNVACAVLIDHEERKQQNERLGWVSQERWLRHMYTMSRRDDAKIIGEDVSPKS